MSKSHPAGAFDAGGSVGEGAVAPVCIALTGNCQAMFVATVLNTLPGVEAIFFAGPYRHVRFEGQTAATEPIERRAAILKDRKAAGAKIVLCEQTSPVTPVTDPKALGARVDLVVRFPNLQAYALWPTKLYDAEQIARLTPERMHRLDRASNAASIAKADVDVGAYLNEHFQDQILFDSPQHPSPQMMSVIIAGILDRLAPVARPPSKDDLVRRIAESRGINTVFSHPIDKKITDSLGCRWAETPLYTLWRSVAAAAKRGEHETVRRGTAELLDRVAEEPHFGRMVTPDALLVLSDSQRKLGDQAGADATAERAIAADRENPTLYAKRGTHQIHAGRIEDAIASYRHAHELNPDNPLYFERLGMLFAKKGSLEEAVGWYRAIAGLKKRNVKALRALAAIEMRQAVEALDRADAALVRARVSDPEITVVRNGLVKTARAIQDSVELVSSLKTRGAAGILKSTRPMAHETLVARVKAERARAKAEIERMNTLRAREEMLAERAAHAAKAFEAKRAIEQVLTAQAETRLVHAQAVLRQEKAKAAKFAHIAAAPVGGQLPAVDAGPTVVELAAAPTELRKRA